MENKYYRPETTELRVGLEYETLRERKGGTMVPKEKHIERWSKEVMDEWNLANILTSWPHIIRVKYLDLQDVEELGFEPSYDEPDEWFHNYKGNGDIQLYFKDKPENMELGIPISIYNDILVFSGYVRNKSELIFILKRVDIYGK